VTQTCKTGDWHWYDPHTILEEVSYQESYECNSTNFTGDLATSKYDRVRNAFIGTDVGSFLVYDYDEAAITFEGISFAEDVGKFALTSAVGDIYPDIVGPAIFRSSSSAVAKQNMGCIVAIALSLPEFAQAGVNYFTAENSIAKQQAKEQLITAYVGLGLSLIGVAIGGPYMLIFMVVWKGLIYGMDALGWIPSNCKVETLADPAALIAFAIAYLAGSPPSELCERALTDASTRASDWVADYDEDDDSDRVHVYIPPKYD